MFIAPLPRRRIARAVSRLVRGVVNVSRRELKGCLTIISEGTGSTSSFFESAQYRFALMRDIDPSLETQALRMSDDCEEKSEVHLDRARQHHDSMLGALRSCDLEVVQLPSDGLADSVFVEDTLVVVGDVALLTKPGAKSRQAEVHRVREAITRSSLTHALCSPSPSASLRAACARLPALQVVELQRGTLDGGDVLFTGKEFFVGVSQRSNEEGIRGLAKAFPSHRITAVHMTHPDFIMTHSEDSESVGDRLSLPPLHLKSMCSRGGDHTLLLGGPLGPTLSRLIAAASPHTYDFVLLPDAAAANCVWVNGVLVRPLAEEMCRESDELLQALPGRHVQVATSELAKLDGAITCCSVLIQ